MTAARLQLKEAIFVYLLLFVSGSVLYMQSSNMFLILVFIITLVSWLLTTDRKINEKFVLYIIVFVGLLLIISFYTGGGLRLEGIVGTTLRLAIAYLILQIVGASFVETYLRVITFIAIVSLLGLISDQFSLFDSVIRKLLQVGDKGYEGIFYIYRYRGGDARNNSIFYEAGAYQGFLNAGLYLLLFVKTSFSETRRWMYIGILIVTLFSTFSTTGYLMFSGMFGYYLLVNKTISVSLRLGIVAASILAVLAFSAQFHYVIVEKIDSYTSIEGITDSRNRRSFDALVDLEIFKSNVFGVGYKRYWERFGAIGAIGEGTGSSNGVTRVLAIYGWPFALFLFGSFYWAIVRLSGSPLSSLIPFVMIMMFLVGESWYVFSPACLSIIAAAFVYPGVYERREKEEATLSAA